MMKLTTVKNGKTFSVKLTGSRYYYFSPMQGRYFPVKASAVKTSFGKVT